MSTTVSALNWRRLKALAAQSGRTVSEVLDQLIDQAVSHPPVAALLAEAGLADVEDAGDDPVEGASGEEFGGRGAHPVVLVVEDHPECRELLRARLEFMGCDVITADIPEEVMDRATVRQPGLIIMDLTLYGDAQAGLAMINRLRATPETAKIPIAIHSIFVRHRAELPRPLPRVEALLPKPFKFKQLVELVASHYKAAGREATDVVLI